MRSEKLVDPALLGEYSHLLRPVFGREGSFVALADGIETHTNQVCRCVELNTLPPDGGPTC